MLAPTVARDYCSGQAREKPTPSGCSITSPFRRQLDLVEHVISDEQLAKFVEATKEDEIGSDLQQVILSGWPDSRGHVPFKTEQFWNYRDELLVAHGLIEGLWSGHMGLSKDSGHKNP